MKIDDMVLAPELLLLRYKGILAPWEIIGQAKRFGFKCKKYVNWKEVHATEHSRGILKEVGDSLIDSQDFRLEHFGELSQIWEKVQRWSKDKEKLSVEPDIHPEFENFSRLIDVGSKNGDIIDLIIDEFGFSFETLDIDARWTLFLAINIHKLLQENNRFSHITGWESGRGIGGETPGEFITLIRHAIVAIYLALGFDVSQNSDQQVILLLVRELGCSDTPINTARGSPGKTITLPKVWVDVAL
jgi:hypothetical protein